ncbi:MAG: phage terminase small subunit P27 family [Cetobacterium sp.]
MAGRKKMTVEAILANGGKHLTKAEIETRKRKEEELDKLANDKIKPPAWLSNRAKKIFKDIVKELEPISLLVNVDNYNLAVLSDAIDNFINATLDIQSKGQTEEIELKGGATSTQANPSVSIQLKYSEVIRKISADFALTPQARLKIIEKATPDPNDDEKQFEDDFGDI